MSALECRIIELFLTLMVLEKISYLYTYRCSVTVKTRVGLYQI